MEWVKKQARMLWDTLDLPTTRQTFMLRARILEGVMYGFCKGAGINPPQVRYSIEKSAEPEEKGGEPC